MTEDDKPEPQGLSERQAKAIPHLVAAPTFEEGRKKARVSRNALYEWLKNPTFKAELQRQRNIIVEEAIETLKGNVTKAVDSLIKLLSKTKNENLKRSIAKDIIDYTLKGKEMQELEERLASIETIVLERRTYK